MFNFTWHGNRFYEHVSSLADKRMMLAGAAIVAKAKELAPEDTGKLKASISFIYRQSDRVLMVYADVPYAIFVEFGTYFMRARPYLRPAMAAASLVWGSELHLAFNNVPVLKSDLARPRNAHHREIMTHNRAVSTGYNRGVMKTAKRHIRRQVG